jgi:hypothetical protein
MNTTGIQNYLSNVFTPIYFYDATNSNFTPKLELTNIDTYSGNTVSTFRADVGDSASNVYVGKFAGNSFSNTQNCSFVTALGFGAGSNISNDSNSVYIGWFAGKSGSNSLDVISIGTDSGKGNGSANIFLGTSTGTVGQSNIFIGHYINPSTTVSNQIRIGYRNQIPIAADLSKNWVGLGGPLSPEFGNNKLDVSGNVYIKGQLGLNTIPGGRTLDVNGNFRSTDASGNVLDFQSNGITRSTGGFNSSNGTISGTGSANTPIGTLKKGIMFISVQDAASTTTHFASSMAYCSDPTDGTYVFDMSGSRVSRGDVTLNYNSSNIRFSNAGATRNFSWSITYFPLP